MLIGIDGNEANIKDRVGVGRYCFELLKKFKEYQIPNYKFQIYLKDEPLYNLPKETDWWRYIIVKPQKLWTQFALPLYLFTHFPRPDVFFTPSHYSPRFCPCPTFMSIMDLSYIKYPEMFKASDLWQLKNWTAYSIKKAARILTISQASKDDIIKYYGVEKERVIVTYPGINITKNMKHITWNIIKEKYGIDGDYILSVGTLQPRKNYVKLIEAYSRINSNYNQIHSNKFEGNSNNNSGISLVIVGKKGWMWEEILAAPKKFGIEDKVTFLDYVSDEDLPVLYQNAKCFVLISLYEGFGLPALEAMSYGCPVIVSNVSSLPEVVGEAGILVDPNNAGEITEAINKVIRDNKTREEMIKKGLKQAAKFSWEKCARETLKVIEEVGGGHV